MAPFIFFIALFLCGLLNSYFKLSAWLRPTKKPTTSAPAANFETKKIKPAAETAKAADDELETIFSTFDSDGDGFITLEELQDSLRRLKLPVTADEAQSMMERVDTNGDGLIDLGEFRELYESLDPSSNGKELGLREAFEVFDGNRDGVISVEELREVLVSMGLKGEGEVEDCRDMIRRVDLDGDGKVNFEEFKNMMLVKA